MIKNISFLLTIAAIAVVTASSFISVRPYPAIYTADAAQSKVTWTGKKVTGQHTGTVQLLEGSVAVEGNAIKAGSFTIDVSSITNTDIKDSSSNAKLVGHLKSEDFFNTAAYPKAKLAITSSVLTAKGVYEITGNLTIKDITKPITFPATVTITENTLTAVSEITIDRTQYDIKYRSASFFSGIGDKAIDNNFILNVSLVAVK